MPGLGNRLGLGNHKFGGISLLPRNTDTVRIGAGRNTIVETNANISGDATYRDLLIKSHVGRIRQDEFLTEITFYCGLADVEIALMISDGKEFSLKVWRENGSGTFDQIGKENIVSKLTGETTNTVVLDTPIEAQEGDFIGFGINRGYGYLYAAGTGQIKYTTGVEMPTVNADFDAQSTINLDIPVRLFGQAPLIVGIGDSIMAGHNDHFSFLETNDVTDLSHQIMYQLAQKNSNLIYQNMGIGSQTSASIDSRFAGDCVNLEPRYVVINVGVNDIVGAVSKATYIANMTSILNKCDAASIIPIIMKILPWSNGTNVQMQSRDDWMTDLKALLDASYSDAIWVDNDESIGEFRSGGDAGNLWDIQAAYDADGVHLNEAGYTKAAETIYAAL